MLVGTDDNEAGAWRFDGSWQQIAALRHEVAVIAVGCAEEQGLACSVSRDGILIVWRYLTGELLLRTFVDVEPNFVGFLADGRAATICRLMAHDRSNTLNRPRRYDPPRQYDLVVLPKYASAGGKARAKQLASSETEQRAFWSRVSVSMIRYTLAGPVTPTPSYWRLR